MYNFIPIPTFMEIALTFSNSYILPTLTAVMSLNAYFFVAVELASRWSHNSTTRKV